ncbi:MAG: DEAD/DEAH box helicase [Solirubrobacteraceae bacterium]
MSATTTPALRQWQLQALAAMEQWPKGTFLMAAAPGAGKTRPALEQAVRLLYAREADRIALVCPTAPLTRQWAEAAARLGLHLAPDATELTPPAGFHGVAVTYARVAQSAERWASQCLDSTFVIADEAHHLGDEMAWGQGFTRALGRARRWLLLSGTPFRSDASPIPGVRYDDDGMARPDHAYGYAEAVRDGVCRPVTFIPFDGTMTWRSGEETVEGSFADQVAGEERSRRYRTAISADLEGALPKILGEAHRRLLGVRESGGAGPGGVPHADAGGLVVAADGEHARAVAAVLHRIVGSPPTVVMHTDPQAHRRLAEFTHASDPWIVAVNMVSEGVDIPRLRVGVYATAAKTAMIFRQIVGRFVRTVPGRPLEPSWIYLPAEATLRAHAAEVDRDLIPLLRRREDADPDQFLDDEALDAANRVEDEAGLRPAFEALAADMAPAAQLDLFGGATPVVDPQAQATAAGAVATLGGPVPAGPPAATQEVPLWQRRQQLRDLRHGLVSELGRKRGASQREVNAWVNRKVGITRVEQATVDQLEQSIDVLHDALAGRG